MRKQRLNSGQMHSKIDKYEFKNGRLAFSKSLYAKTEKKNARCIYSERGTASPDTLEIDFYKSADITPANLIKFGGVWYAVSFSTNNDNRIYGHAVCGRCVVSEFTLAKTKKKHDEYNTPIFEESESVIFDGIVCEKFIRSAEDGHFTKDLREYVIIYPKEIELNLSDVICDEKKKYYITETHEGAYLNEAVVVYRGDV